MREGGSGRHLQRVGSRHSPAWQLPGLVRVYASRAIRTRFRVSSLGGGGDRCVHPGAAKRMQATRKNSARVSRHYVRELWRSQEFR